MRKGLSKAALLALAGALAGMTPTVAVARSGDPLPAGWQAIGATVDGHTIGFAQLLAGRVSAFAVVPSSPSVQIAGTLGGIWRKAGNAAWVDVTSATWPSTAVSALAVDPVNSQIVYAGTGSDDATVQPGQGVLKSTDGGHTWQPLAASEAPMRGYAINGLAVDPLNDMVVVAAAENGLFRSADAGASWSEVLAITPGFFGTAETRVTVDPVSGVMLAGVAQSSGIVASTGSGSITTGHAVFRSTDHGLTWSPFALDSSTTGGEVVASGIASSGGSTYAYALDITGDSAMGLYTSADGGRTWALQTTQDIVDKATIAELVVDPLNPTTAYFAQESGLFVYSWGSSSVAALTSADGTTPQFGDWRALAIGAHGSGRALYSGTDGGPNLFDLTTVSYKDESAGMVSGIDYFGAASSPTNEVTGAQDLGVDANSGTGNGRDLYNADAYGILIDKANPSTYYAAVNGAKTAFIVSHDAGATWHYVHLSPAVKQPYYMRPVQAYGATNVIILPESSGTLHVSNDGGTTWTTRKIRGLRGDYVTIVRSALTTGTSVPVMYAGTGFGRVWRSADLGATWSKLHEAFSLSVRDIAIDAAGSGGAGAEHVLLALGTYAPVAYASFATVGDVQRTTNSGSSWTDIGQALSGTSVNAVMLSGSTVLVGTDRGVFDNAGGTWSAAGSGFPNVRVNDLFLSQDGGAFFAITWGRGTLTAAAAP